MTSIDIEVLKEDIANLEKEVVEKKRAVNTILTMMNESPIYDVERSAVQIPRATLSGHEYYMKPLATAVSDILAGTRHPMTGEDIFEQLTAGGYEFAKKGNPFKNTMISIGKNQKFHRLPNEKYGLRGWYPELDKKEPKSHDDKGLNANDSDGDNAEGNQDE